MVRNIPELLCLMEENYADRTAFRWVNEETDQIETVHYRQFVMDICGCIGLLEKKVGPIKNKHVALLAQNSYLYLVYFFSILAAAGTAVLLNIQKDKQELQYEIDLADVDVLITDGTFFAREGFFDNQNDYLLIEIEQYFENNGHRSFATVDEQDLAVIIFTSGTTGHSKGVMLSHEALVCLLKNRREETVEEQLIHGRNSEDIIDEMLVYPLYHVAAWNRVFTRLYEGNAINLCLQFKNLFHDLERMPSDFLGTVPVIFQSVCDKVLKGKGNKLGKLRSMSVGGAAMSHEVIQVLIEKCYSITYGYGMTELSIGGTHNLCNQSGMYSSVGKPDTVFQVKLIDGELCFKGKGMMMGYYKNPEATHEAIDEDGWLHTGDLARIDEEGYIYIVGRKKNLIILDSGENINPEELENLVMQEQTVLEVLVKEETGKIVAEVYCEEQNRDTVRLHIRKVNSRVALYKHIGVVKFRDEPFPRTGSGKIKR